MEQTPPQNLMSSLPRAPVNAGSAPDYWNNLDALYNPNSDQHAHPAPQRLQQPAPQPPQQPQQQPMGISWDHPVFSQQHPQQTTPLQPQPQQEPGHGLYTAPSAQSWRANSLHHQSILPSASPHGYGVPGQYRQLHQFPQGQVPFDSRPLTPSDNSAFQTYQFPPRNYFPPQHMAVPETFSQSPTPQATQTPPQPVYPPVAHSNAINGYPLPASFSEENSHPLDLTQDFTEPMSNVPGHQTINPQFLDTPQASNQHPSFPNFLYTNPNEFQGSHDPKVFDFYRNDIQLQAVAPAVSNQGVPIRPHGTDGLLPVNGQKPMAVPVPIKPADARKQIPITKVLPKKSTGKVNGKKVGKTSSGSESESDSDLEIEEPPEASPLPPSRPTEPEAAANYDTLRAVWFPRNRRPHADKVKSALVAFKDVVKKVRDAWKDKTQAMKMAENKGDNDKAAKFKKETASQRRIMDVVVKTTLEKAHPAIIEKLGEHPIAVSAMYSFLLDRHQASDIDGTLTVNLLALLSRFTTMDDEALQKTNVAKLLPRFVKKGGPKVRALAQKILDNAAASTKRKQENVKPGSKEGSPSKNGASADSPPADGVRTEAIGTKRAREGDSNGQPATKKMVVTSNPKNPTKPSNPAAMNGAVKKPQESAAAIAARPKANIIAPKPTNLFGSLSSASKRPGTSNAERAAAAAAAPKPSTSADKKDSQPAPPRPTFSFGDLMADLNKPKEPAPAKPTENKTPETEEERTKRLRKEARRKLRVTWKPDSQLVQVRTFTHDPDEELHLGDHAQREIGDVKGEGSVLKLHRGMDEMDEDDDVGFRDETLFEYYEPSAIDDENTTSQERSGNFIKRGGVQQPVSAEKEAQDHREATTLMVFYTSPDEVPSSPKEPPAPTDEEIATDVVEFGELPDKVKARQERYFAMVNPKPAPPAQPSAPNNQFDISNLLKIIQNVPQQQQSTPPPPPPQAAPQSSMSDLERTINIFRQQQQQQQVSQPAHAPMMQMPQLPPASQPPAAQAFDFQKILAVVNAQNNGQQPPVMPQPPPQPQLQQSQPSIAPNLAAIVSQFANSNQQTAPNFPPQQGGYEDPDRKRMREGNYDGYDDDRYGHPKRGRGPPGKRHPKAGLVPCRYWPEGKCIKGDDCTFRHDPLN